MNKGLFLIALTAFPIFVSPLLAEDEPFSVKALQVQGNRLARQERQLGEVSPKAAFLLKLLQQDLKTLTSKIEKTEPPREFMFSLRRDVALLAGVNAKKPTPKDIRKLRRALASIDLKVHNLEKREGKFNITWAEGLPKEPEAQNIVFESLNTNLGKARVRIKVFTDFDEESTPLFESATRDIRNLTMLSNKHDVPRSYLLSLAQDAHLLALAGKKQTPAVVAAVYFRDAAEDLHVKAESSRARKKSPFQEVETHVETRDPNDGDKPKKGYEVWYAPKGLANNHHHWKRFKQFSTPSVEGRVPGCYEMRTKKQAKEGEETDVEVKDNGKGRCPVDLWIPKQG